MLIPTDSKLINTGSGHRSISSHLSDLLCQKVGLMELCDLNTWTAFSTEMSNP